MDKSIESTTHELATVRTGPRVAAPARPRERRLLRRQTPLKQIATVAATEARLLTITPYDKSSIKAIEKAILESDLGLTPSNDGNLIRLTIPELTEERRKELVKVVHRLAEDGRVAVRNIRRDCMHHLRDLRKERRGRRGRGAPRRGRGSRSSRTPTSRTSTSCSRVRRRDPGRMSDRPRYVAIIMDGNARWAAAAG